MLSIIITIYNTEKYLYHCIMSILKQIFPDFQFLLTNHSATNNSGSICDYYSKNDNRIKGLSRE